MRWKVYYIDGTTFSNEDGNPEDAPGGGVLAVAAEDKVTGHFIHESHDFYVFDEQYDGWYGVDYFGFTQYLVRPGKKIVKLGEAVNTKVFREVLAKIRKDPGLPDKSAFYDWERRF